MCSPSTSTIHSGLVGLLRLDPAAEQTTVHEGLAGLLYRYDVNDYAASVKVYAVRPKA